MAHPPVLQVDTRVELVFAAGATMVRARGRISPLTSPETAVRSALRAADGTRGRDAIAAAMSGTSLAQALAVVDELVVASVLVPRKKKPAPTSLRVAVWGRGGLAAALASRLTQSRLAVTPVDDATASSGHDLVLWARESVTLGAAFADADVLLEQGTPALFALVEGEQLTLGPLTVPGKTACLACAFAAQAPGERAREALAQLPVGTCAAPLAERVVADVVAVLMQTVRADAQAATLLRERVTRSERGGVHHHAAWPRAGCASCERALVRATRFDLAAGLVLGSAPRASAMPDTEGRAGVRHVGVIGGGTAGLLTALALREQCPDVRVTLIESSSIPVIGVGEATTPDLVEFLLRTLHIDELELYREVLPTWKLGIRFFWGDPGPSYFHHPFAGPHLLEACALGDRDLQSLGGALMARDLSPVLRAPDGRLVPLLTSTAYAYHLDNKRFVRFLHMVAARRGIEVVDAIVEEVTLDEAGAVGSLRARDGRRFSFDLYVDATGFRSLLLEKSLGVPFRSYAESLFCDTAVTADVPHGGTIVPYTLAETMDAGWCWKIPQREDDHRGYVFSSRFLSPDVAAEEMRRKNPGMGEPKLVRFRSGRLAECWTKNVFGVGNSYAFVEPLESTALHMLLLEIKLLVSAISGAATETARHRINETMGHHWDRLRDFLALHYRFNRKLDTAFWRTARDSVALCDGQALLDAFREGAPLTARPDRELLQSALLGDGFFGLLGVDNVLLGQNVSARMLRPAGDVTPFRRWARGGLPAILGSALPQREALDAYVGWLEGSR